MRPPFAQQVLPPGIVSDNHRVLLPKQQTRPIAG
jgi:hypothetical protein